MTTVARRSRLAGGRVWLWLAAGLAMLFLAAPTLIVVPLSLTSSRFLTFPPPGWSSQWYARLFESLDWTNAALSSLQVGLGTTVCASILGTCAALGLRSDFPGKEILRAFMLSPLLVPGIVLAIAYYTFFSVMSLQGIRLLDSSISLIIAHTTITIPFVVVTVTASLANVDQSLMRAAESLGASPSQIFWRVTFPLIRSGIATGALFTFLTSFDELIIALFLSGSNVRTLPVRMWDGIRFEVEPTLAAVATLLILVSLAVLATAEFLKKNNDRR
ncbi:MAG: ABC transporter permease [Mesorhizobium sp.]